jgi:hypothetical protein
VLDFTQLFLWQRKYEYFFNNLFLLYTLHGTRFCSSCTFAQIVNILLNMRQVVVSTKSPKSDKQYVWEAVAESSSYVIKEEADPEKILARGTQITLFLRVSSSDVSCNVISKFGYNFLLESHSYYFCRMMISLSLPTLQGFKAW